MRTEYNQQPLKIIEGKNREIAIFSTEGKNIDAEVVRSFGDEWLKFHDFSDQVIEECAAEYFDILNDTVVNKNSYALDIGCGTGRWTKYLTQKAGFIEAIDPSNAIFAADNLLGKIENVRLTQASIETIPFNDETFDFAMSVGVLHHIPDTQQAMKDCVKKIKKGGYFYCYLYHNLETRGWWFKTLYNLSNLIRYPVCRLPTPIKKFVCDILAIVIYMPLVLWVRFLVLIGLRSVAHKMPLSAYNNKSFFIIRNDALDKFGTRLEQRFSKKQVISMMQNCGLTDIVISPLSPFYHVTGRKL
ncbi:class I SAM-dependent methyltransferase [Ferruginibacter albus]|uniref:class I SAM-dependent methyltransferase n=1 Tax=Ferruginibacter albus TaxID=2875540 RepID=UPI001CC813EC|nr:class I SAM-dependent methyltransferase [Ferruginibacter albus]UAY52225.1 class I SAM-dependent methyltransferase [Ferruginibacter albus]